MENNFHMAKMMATGGVGAVTAGGAVIITKLDFLEQWVRIAGGIVLIFVSTATGVFIVVKGIQGYWLRRLATQKLEAQMCKECQSGTVPPYCFLTKKDKRHKNCPHDSKIAGAMARR